MSSRIIKTSAITGNDSLFIFMITPSELGNWKNTHIREEIPNDKDFYATENEEARHEQERHAAVEDEGGFTVAPLV